MDDGRYMSLYAYCQELEYKYDVLKDAMNNLYMMTQYSQSDEGKQLHGVAKRAINGIKGEAV